MKVNINWDKFDSDRYRPLAVEEVPNFKPGTISYDDYWDKQDDFCLNGFKPNPFMPRISGVHYFYLNMNKIMLLKKGATRKTLDHPFYREVDRRVFDEIEEAKKGKYGLIVGKPRRVGMSYIGSVQMFYELLFFIKNEIGVAAGIEEKAADFYEKIKSLVDNVRKEYQTSILVRNSEELKLGYFTYDNKQKKEAGLLSSLYMKTMYAKPEGFEGKSLSMVVFEEAGIFADLIAAYKSTEPCFKEGNIQFGTPLIYGTGGDIEGGSKGYMAMWNAKREVYNLKKIALFADDYYPGDGVPDEKTKKVISFFDFKTGRTNSVAARNYILADRKSKEGTEGFIKHIQSYPLKETDYFIKNSGGLLNRKKLNAAMHNIDNCPYLKQLGRLEWHTNDPVTKKLASVARSLKEIDKIHFQRNSKLKFIEDEELGTINKLLDPIKNKNLAYHPDIAGCDSYDEEMSDSTSASNGATMIYRCFHGIDQPSDLAVAYIEDRSSGDSDDEFYSNSFRLCVYYDVELLVEYTKIAIIGYFKDVGGEQHLKRRPTIDGYKSKAQNPFGFRMPNQHAWALTLRLLKQEVNMNFQNMFFEKIISSLLTYGEENSDLGSAYAMVLVSKLDMFGDITDGLESAPNEYDVIDSFGFYKIENGQAIFKTYSEHQEDEYDEDYTSVHKMRKFDPEIDLVGQEKESFLANKISVQKNVKLEQKNILEKYDNDIMAFTINEFLNKK